jgi:hypothetical protein
MPQLKTRTVLQSHDYGDYGVALRAHGYGDYG